MTKRVIISGLVVFTLSLEPEMLTVAEGGISSKLLLSEGTCMILIGICVKVVVVIIRELQVGVPLLICIRTADHTINAKTRANIFISKLLKRKFFITYLASPFLFGISAEFSSESANDSTCWFVWALVS